MTNAVRCTILRTLYQQRIECQREIDNAKTKLDKAWYVDLLNDLTTAYDAVVDIVPTN
jgi:hypothetical protein